MDEFNQIVANSITSREEVEMVSNAQIGAEYDIKDEAEEVVTSAAILTQHARFQAFMINRNPGNNPFGMR